MKTLKIVGLLIVGLVAGLLISAISGKSQLGGVYNQSRALGPQGTLVSKFITGQVNCSSGTATLTTGNKNTYDCAVTGVASGDNVVVALGNPISGLAVAGAYASTTVGGYFELVLGSATSTTVNVGIATTSVSYIITK